MPSSDDLAATRAFFGVRAAGWDAKWPDDGPRYARAVAQLAPPPGGTVLDAACGTGRALPALRAAVGPRGRVLGIDVTPEMVAEASRASSGRVATRGGSGRVAALVLGDVRRLPLPDGCLDAVLAAALVPHLADPVAGLAELARASRRGARLAVFHPAGRAALAVRHGRPDEAGDDDLRAPARITVALVAGGWTVERIDDGAERYLVLAVRTGARDG